MKCNIVYESGNGNQIITRTNKKGQMCGFWVRTTKGIIGPFETESRAKIFVNINPCC